MSLGPGDLPIRDYLINGSVALAGGAIRFLKIWMQNYAHWTAGRVLLEAAMGAVTAAFVGVITYWVLTSWGVSGLYTAAAVAIMGHAGPDGLAMLKDAMLNAIRSRLETPPK